MFLDPRAIRGYQAPAGPPLGAQVGQVSAGTDTVELAEDLAAWMGASGRTRWTLLALDKWVRLRWGRGGMGGISIGH
ncbi:uncharacterized protein N7482_009390 [Penicillium canariense]|uniref:Uncharacterized protein n=1 Tax=Penicillium canariense TaxID=189055 RepID=A0A9W9HP40_9EURO|nr:uncharacterized protein N7482_009390 [Penicillium canariense]KAJ5152912.1 hypothetical protein N7482_009390 [Penicillium canariense]